MDLLEGSVFFSVVGNNSLNTVTFTVVDYTQLSGVEVNIGIEQVIEGVALDWVAETSNTVTAENLYTVLNAQIPLTYSDIVVTLNGTSVILRRPSSAMVLSTSSDPVNLTVTTSRT